MRLRVVAVLSAALVASTGVVNLPAAATVGAGGWTRCAGNWGQPSHFGLSAQDYGPGHDDLDSFGAADLNLPTGCDLGLVRIDGIFGSPPSRAITLSIYGTANSKPDEADLRCTETIAAPGPDYRVVFSTPCRLEPGRYWLVGQVQLDYGDGDWAWSLTATIHGSPALWKNPGGGAGSPCVDWGTIPECRFGQNQDFRFKVKERRP